MNYCTEFQHLRITSFPLENPRKATFLYTRFFFLPWSLLS